MGVLIERIELKNYRSCQRTTIDLDPQLSTLIGTNGSGKTNLLHGILLLPKMARVQRYARHADFFPSECSLYASFNIDGKHRVLMRARINYATSERNTDEVLLADQKWNFEDVSGRKGWVDRPLPIVEDLSRTKQRTFWAEDFALYPHQWTASCEFRGPKISRKEQNDLEKEFAACFSIASYINGISYYSASQFTDPSRCPIYLEIEDNRPSRRRGSATAEHVQFLQDLYTTYKERKDAFDEYLSFVGAAGVGLIDRITFKETKAPANVYDVRIGGKLEKKAVKRLLVIPSLHIGRNHLSPNQLSEGTFKTLALVFYLMTDKGKLLLIEEPEVCVHHGLLKSIVELIKIVSKRKQIVISTHSDFVLDGLDPKNVFIIKNEVGQGTVVRHVPNAMSKSEYAGLKEYLKTSGNLGEYWREGGLDQ